MKPTQERSAKKSLKTAIVGLQSIDVLLNGVFARDSETIGNDGYPSHSTGGGGGAGKGSHSDRTSDHAMRSDPIDVVHADVEKIVDAINDIKTSAQRIEKIARRLTAHERSGVII
jgi:hypothetical protein